MVDRIRIPIPKFRVSQMQPWYQLNKPFYRREKMNYSKKSIKKIN